MRANKRAEKRVAPNTNVLITRGSESLYAAAPFDTGVVSNNNRVAFDANRGSNGAADWYENEKQFQGDEDDASRRRNIVIIVVIIFLTSALLACVIAIGILTSSKIVSPPSVSLQVLLAF